MGKKTGEEQAAHKDVSLGEWLQWSNREYPMPCYSAIPHISTILDGCPEGFRPAMLFHLLGGYGALAFSNVRARYLDGRYHSPSLQVVIEGEQGSGKSVSGMCTSRTSSGEWSCRIGKRRAVTVPDGLSRQ